MKKLHKLRNNGYRCDPRSQIIANEAWRELRPNLSKKEARFLLDAWDKSLAERSKAPLFKACEFIENDSE